MFDDGESLSKPDEMTIPQAQVIYKELNEGKLLKQLRFFSGGSSKGSSELKIHEMEKIGTVNKSNEAFLDYLMLKDYAHATVAKNKIKKLHLDTGNNYRGNMNLEENIDDFLLEQQNEEKNS